MTNRRQFLQQASLGAGGLLAASALNPLMLACAENEKRSLGVALVGLGNYSTGQLGPALRNTKHCHLAGIVSGSADKAAKWAKEYNISPQNVYTYETFDRIADNPDIDFVYIVLPNSMHAEYAIRAAKAGKHVMCEKPMATSVADAEAMIAACKAANKKLAIGYRLYHEPFNREMMRLGQEKVHGAVRLIEASFGWRGVGWDNWRFNHAMAGGGALMDVGIYCIRACSYVLGENPLSVMATEVKTHPHFKEVDETLMWHMEFPSGAVASCTTSYAINVERLHVAAENGDFGLSPAYSYDGQRGYAGGKALEFPHIAEQSNHMDAFARHIRDNEANLTPGEMGLQDMKVIEAIYLSIKEKRRVSLV
ncbi:MAG: gfo/Idh/MocA family oxidoreductase [Bacteroidetes bacterium]|nr:MAG: gfo/Idh/MocA family oxidoreductase [Bacteroidota bacterium]